MLRFNVPPSDLVVGRVFVPTLARRWKDQTEFRSKRNELFEKGLYPGVDYRIEELCEAEGTCTVRPIYPVRDFLERDWPVCVKSDLAPRWMEPMAYNVMTAGFGLALGAGLLSFGVLLSLSLTLSVVPSASMVPAIMPGDAILVEKLTPRLPRFLAPISAGDLVFFEPPAALQEIVKERANGATAKSNQLFVKRVVALPGDEVSVGGDGSVSVSVEEEEEGKRRRASPTSPTPRGPLSRDSLARLPPLRAGTFQIAPETVFVLGDNAEVSIDSRCWGPLDERQVAGKPLMRLFPLDRMGVIK